MTVGPGKKRSPFEVASPPEAPKLEVLKAQEAPFFSRNHWDYLVQMGGENMSKLGHQNPNWVTKISLGRF